MLYFTKTPLTNWLFCSIITLEDKQKIQKHVKGNGFFVQNDNTLSVKNSLHKDVK